MGFLYHLRSPYTIFFSTPLKKKKQICRVCEPLQRFEVLLPLQGKHTFLLIIAGFAAGNQIIFCAETATGQRHQMIHGEIFKGRLLVAEITYSRSRFLLPPSTLPQISGLGSFAADNSIVRCIKIGKVPAHPTSSPSKFFRDAPMRYRDPAIRIRSSSVAKLSAASMAVSTFG